MISKLGWVTGVTAIAALTILALENTDAQPSRPATEQIYKGNEVTVTRVVDSQAGVYCYLAKSVFTAQSPSISCVYVP
jgi:hypothetical protein